MCWSLQGTMIWGYEILPQSLQKMNSLFTVTSGEHSSKDRSKWKPHHSIISWEGGGGKPNKWVLDDSKEVSLQPTTLVNTQLWMNWDINPGQKWWWTQLEFESLLHNQWGVCTKGTWFFSFWRKEGKVKRGLKE